MFCEKCGKKISYKKAQCDYCKQPIEYEGFSKIEYEPSEKHEPALGRMSKMEFVAPPAPPAKGIGKLIAISCASVAVVIVVCVSLIAMVISDKNQAANTKNNGSTVVNYEEIYTRDVFSKYEEKDYSYAYIDFDGDFKNELIIRSDIRKYTIYYINQHKAEKVKKGEFEADEFYFEFGDNKFYGKIVNKPDDEKDDTYFKFDVKDGKLIKENLKKKPDDLGLPYMEFKNKPKSNQN